MLPLPRVVGRAKEVGSHDGAIATELLFGEQGVLGGGVALSHGLGWRSQMGPPRTVAKALAGARDFKGGLSTAVAFS